MADSGSEDDVKVEAPKFSSFKAKAQSPSEDVKSRHDRSRRSTETPRPEKRHGSHHHRSHESASSHRRRENAHPPRDRHSAQNAQSKQPVSSETSQPKVYFRDTKGDHLISRYGGIDRAQIPRYHRHGGGRILGTIGRLVIHRDGARDSFSLRFPGQGFSLLNKDGLRSTSWTRLQTEPPIRLQAKTKSAARGDAQMGDDKDDEEGFISMQSSRKRKRIAYEDSSSDEGPSYKSIDVKAKGRAREEEDDSEASSSEGERVDPDEDNPLRWKSMQLNRRLKDHPGDIDAWLELVDHQDDLQRAGESIDERTSADAAHSFSEIKVSMLESALGNAIVAEDRATILVRLMREGMKIWSSNAAAKKWEHFSSEEANNFELWRAHIDFAMSNITALKFEDLKQMLLERLHKVVARSGLQDEGDTGEAIYVFLRAMRFVHDSGYKELAVAAWQAMMEATFFRPALGEYNPQPLESFRDFWESEAPRVGEAEAQGWKQFVAASGQVEAPAPRSEDSSDGIATSDVYKAWNDLERRRAQGAKKPARTLDEGTEDDPFRVVMFSDIEPWLFMIPEEEEEARARVREQLLDAFLLFCGLPPAFRTSKWTELALGDQFTRPFAVIDSVLRTASDSFNHPGEGQRTPPDFGASNGCMAISSDVLFPGEHWFRYFGCINEDLAVDVAWLLTCLGQLVHTAGIAGLARYYLGLSYARDAASVKKVAKTLLKKYPKAAELYNAYALAESANGNFEVATRVISSATQSSSLSAGTHGYQLLKSWSLMEFRNNKNKGAAIARMCSIVDASLRDTKSAAAAVASSMAILKTRQALSSHFDQCLYEGRVGDAATTAECLVWLSFLTSQDSTEPMSAAQGNISAAMALTESLSLELRARGYTDSPDHERLLQWAAQILYMNASHGPFRRCYLREKMSAFLQWCPRNTVLLALMEWADSGLRVIDETRQLLYDKILVKDHDGVSSRVFSIEHEFSRGNVNTTKAAFEHALATDICRFDIGLWVSYIRFCFANGAMRSQAKSVFYRALRCCPWSKEVMMEAFQTLIRDMKSDELRSVYNTMTSKGLRVHIDLEDFVEQWQREKSRRGTN